MTVPTVQTDKLRARYRVRYQARRDQHVKRATAHLLDRPDSDENWDEYLLAVERAKRDFDSRERFAVYPGGDLPPFLTDGRVEAEGIAALTRGVAIRVPYDTLAKDLL